MTAAAASTKSPDIPLRLLLPDAETNRGPKPQWRNLDARHRSHKREYRTRTSLGKRR